MAGGDLGGLLDGGLTVERARRLEQQRRWRRRWLDARREGRVERGREAEETSVPRGGGGRAVEEPARPRREELRLVRERDGRLDAVTMRDDLLDPLLRPAARDVRERRGHHHLQRAALLDELGAAPVAEGDLRGQRAAQAPRHREGRAGGDGAYVARVEPIDGGAERDRDVTQRGRERLGDERGARARGVRAVEHVVDGPGARHELGEHPAIGALTHRQRAEARHAARAPGEALAQRWCVGLAHRRATIAEVHDHAAAGLVLLRIEEIGGALERDAEVRSAAGMHRGEALADLCAQLGRDRGRMSGTDDHRALIGREHHDRVLRAQRVEDGIDRSALGLEERRSDAARHVDDEREGNAALGELGHLGAHDDVGILVHLAALDIRARLAGVDHARDHLHHEIAGGAHVGAAQLDPAVHHGGARARREPLRGRLRAHAELEATDHRRLVLARHGEAIRRAAVLLRQPLDVVDEQIERRAGLDARERAAQPAAAGPFEAARGARPGAAIAGAEGGERLGGRAFLGARDARHHGALGQREANIGLHVAIGAVEVGGARAREGELALDHDVDLLRTHDEWRAGVGLAVAAPELRDRARGGRARPTTAPRGRRSSRRRRSRAPPSRHSPWARPARHR